MPFHKRFVDRQIQNKHMARYRSCLVHPNTSIWILFDLLIHSISSTAPTLHKPVDKHTRSICQNNSVTLQAENTSLGKGQFIDCDKATLKV